MQQPKLVTFIIPIIRPELLVACLDSLYKYTDNSMFYVFVVDQTVHGIDINLRDKYKNLMIIRTPKSDVHTTGNLGHSQATNLGIQLVQTPYICMLNDDVLFISSKWWGGIMETFEDVKKATPTRPALMVNAASIKLPDWSVGRPKGEDHYILPLKSEYTEADWDFLVNEPHYINEHLTIRPKTVIDGVNLYCSVVDTKKLLEVGLIDDFFYVGGANDYDLCCRASMFGYRCVGTTKSWVFHYWSVSFQSLQDEEEVRGLIQEELKHESLEEKWGYKKDKEGNLLKYKDGEREGQLIPQMDLWGCRCNICDGILHTTDGVIAACPKHPEEVYNIPQNTIMPL